MSEKPSFVGYLLSVIHDTQKALGFSEEGQSACNGSAEIVDEIERLMRGSELLQRIHADADQTYEGGSNNGQAKISSDLYQELCEFVARFKS